MGYKPTYNWEAPSCISHMPMPCFILAEVQFCMTTKMYSVWVTQITSVPSLVRMRTSEVRRKGSGQDS